MQKDLLWVVRLLLLFPAIAVLSACSNVQNAVSLPIPPRSTYDHPYQILEEYDRFKDITSVKVELATKETADGRINLYYTYAGQVPKPPRTVDFSISYISKGRASPGCPLLSLLVDGSTRIVPKTSPGVTGQFFTSELSLDDFLKLVNAHRVEGEHCKDYFNLTDQQIQGMRDFASRMKQ